MAILNQQQIMRMKSELMEARALSEKLLQNSRRIVQEYRDTVENSRRLIDASFKLRMRSEERRRVP
jgi:hypothetical protein